MTSITRALHVLATRCTTAPSARAALAAWHEHVDAPLQPVLRRVSHRIALGATIDRALMPLRAVAPDETAALVAVLDAATAHGSSAAVAVRDIASAFEERRAMQDHARSAAAAARTSTRMLAVLAAVFVVLLPSWRSAPLPVVAGSLAVAGCLTWAGLRWARSLSPRPPGEAEVAAVAEAIARDLAAGVALEAALARVAPHDPLVSADLAIALRRRRIGAPWAEAFAASADPWLRRLGGIIASAATTGAPLRAELAAFASSVRYEARRDFELRAKKAPVMLVLPLTLCFLPAFALAILGPLLAGLSA